jgi:hypothetical protein
MGFDPWNCTMKIRKSIGTQTPNMEFTWECEGSFPHTLWHSWEHEMWLPSFPLGLQPCNPFALVANPRLGLRQFGSMKEWTSHFLTLPRAWNVTPGLHFWLAPLQALVLVASQKLRLWHNKNGARCKRLRLWMKITNNLKCYKQCKMYWLHGIISIPKGHMLICGEWVVYGSTHTF